MQFLELLSQTLVNFTVTKSLFTAVLVTISGAVPAASLNLPGVAPPAHPSPVKVRALYLTGWTVGNSANVRHYVELANRTELNTYVVDIKDDDGYVGYESQLPAVREVGGWQKKYDADKVLKAFHEGGIRVIGRIVCFKDPVLSAKRPELAIQDAKGGVWKDKKNKSWLNPYNTKSWPYMVDIAREGIKKGFDEIQFDYVRFANDGDRKRMALGGKGKARYEAINDFLAYGRKELPNVTLSADVFGIICESPEDIEGIGQYLEYVGRDVDYISPMAYPSHYALGQCVNGKKYPRPDLEPYGVVYNTLVKAKKRIATTKEFKAKVRPYLQDFTASWIGKANYQHYGDAQVRQQIKAVYDAGYDEWILWNAGNRYSESALLPKGKKAPAPEVAPVVPAAETTAAAQPLEPMTDATKKEPPAAQPVKTKHPKTKRTKGETARAPKTPDS